MVSFAVQKSLSLIRSHLFIFAFISFALGGWSKKILLWFMYIDLIFVVATSSLPGTPFQSSPSCIMSKGKGSSPISVSLSLPCSPLLSLSSSTSHLWGLWQPPPLHTPPASPVWHHFSSAGIHFALVPKSPPAQDCCAWQAFPEGLLRLESNKRTEQKAA